MLTFNASKIKENSTILQNTFTSDVLNIREEKKDEHWLDETFAVVNSDDVDELLQDINESRVNKDIVL